MIGARTVGTGMVGTQVAGPSATRLRPEIILWGLVALSLATMQPPGDVLDTVRHLRVPDTDDAMRLAEVRDLLSGQGWYDNVQRRFLPPEGVHSHWSRLVDAPIAGLILLLSPLAGRGLAEGLAAFLWPSLLFGIYCLVLYRGTRATFGTRAAILAVLVATQTVGVTVQFLAGRVDHHNVQLVAILGLAFCLIRGSGRAGLGAGALAALSLAVGLEGLPCVVVGALYLALDWCLRGRPALPALAGFGWGLGLTTPLLFAAQTDPGLWGATRCDALSPPWLWLAGGGVGTALACAGLDRLFTTIAHCAERGAGSAPRALKQAGVRLALCAACGTALAGGFALAFPICLNGPFPDMTPLVRQHWLLTVGEMTSLPKFVAARRWEWLAFYPVVAFAAVTTLAMAWTGPQRRAWTVAALFLWPGLALGFFQLRGLYLASGLVPLVAGAVIDRALTLARTRGANGAWRARGSVALGGCLVSTLWMGAVLLADALAPPSLSQSASQGAVTCRGHEAVSALRGLPAGTVLAPIFMGPSILLRTPHAVIAAPYHRAISGLTAAIEGFGGTEADLHRTVAALRVGYLVACPADVGEDLQAETAFATRLTRGEVSSDWLMPVPVAGPLKVWRVAR